MVGEKAAATGEMASAVSVVSEDLGFIPKTHMTSDARPS